MVAKMKTYLEKIIDKIDWPYYRVKHWWSDFVYTQITQVRHKNELFMKLNEYEDGYYVHWDIGNSLALLTFAQFEKHYEKYSHRYYPINEALKPYLEEWKNKEYNKELRDNMKQWYFERKKLYEEINAIHKYISMHRQNNRQLVDELSHESFKDAKHIFVPYEKDPTLSEWKYEIPPKNIAVKRKFDKEGKLICTWKIVKDYTSDLFDLDIELYNKDTEFAKRIIDIRQYLWD